MSPLLVYVALHLCLHSYAAARPLLVSGKESVGQLRLSGEDVKSSAALVLGAKENASAEYDGKILDDASSMQHKVHAVKESDEHVTGNKIKVPYSWEILHKVSDRSKVVWKREERSALESPQHKAAEATDDVNSKEKDGNTAEEDAEVMDYAQPHRKPPIHNRGT